MDKIFFDEICRQEAQLVEQLRVLREFKSTFFNEEAPIVKSIPSIIRQEPAQQTIFPTEIQKKTYKKRVALTIPGMVLNSLSAIKKGSTQDIANKLVQLYPSVPFGKALKDTKHHVSLLSKKRKIRIIEKRPSRLGFIYETLDDL